MADPLTKFGLSRRPASDLFGEALRPKRSLLFDQFGTPDVSGPGWSAAARRGVEEHQTALDEEAALAEERASLEDQRIAREREREAEAAADEFARIKEPSAREKFFDENEATIAGSRRYNQLAEMRQRQPSFADNVLAKNISNKIDDPDERNVFLSAVAKGAGTLAAREEADRFRIKRGAMAALTKAGVHPTEATRIVDEEGYSPDVINYHVAQRENESSFSRDPQARALESYYRTLKDRAAMEKDDIAGSGTVSPDTAAEIRRVSSLLGDKYKMIAEPPAPAERVIPRSQIAPEAAPAAEPADPMSSLRRKLGLVKP